MPPITRLQVNAEINNKIRNKSASDKVNNVEDADSRILMMDYVDQEIAAIPAGPGSVIVEKVVKKSITSAELLNIANNPNIILVQAVPGAILYPTSIIIRYIAGANPYTNNPVLSVRLDNHSVASISTTFTTSWDIENFQLLFLTFNFSSGDTKENKPLTIGSTTNFIGGDGVADVYITYKEITL